MPNTVEFILFAFIAIIFVFLLYTVKSLDELKFKFDWGQERENKFRQTDRERKSKLDEKSVKIPRQNHLCADISEGASAAEWLQKLQYLQQFFNSKASPQFVVELQEFGFGSIWNVGPYKALKYNIYRADLKVGRIEVQKHNNCIVVDLDTPEFYELNEVKHFLLACASAHYPAEPSQSTDRLFNDVFAQSLIYHLWDARRGDLISRIHDWESSQRSLEVAFYGEFMGYDHYCESAAHECKDPFDIEIFEITERARRDGYTVLEGYDEESRKL